MLLDQESSALPLSYRGVWCPGQDSNLHPACACNFEPIAWLNCWKRLRHASERKVLGEARESNPRPSES